MFMQYAIFRVSLNVLLLHCILISQWSKFVSTHNLICQGIPNLTVQQREICHREPQVLSVIREGIQLALSECKALFGEQEKYHHSWNCSLGLQNSLNRLSLNITDKEVEGTKEASFVYSLFSAGVTHTLSKSCSQNNFINCPCGTMMTDVKMVEHYASDLPWKITERHEMPMNEWKWKGCAPNVQFGVTTARQFLDSSEHDKMSAYALLNLHNNYVGRRLIKDGLEIRCQCHGFSGFCTFRTCWYTLRTFRRSTQLLYEQYLDAKQVSYSWLVKSYQKLSKSDAQKRPNRQSKLMRHLQHSITNLTLMKFNEHNPLRHNEPVKIRKRDLVYIIPSVDRCTLLANRTRTCSLRKRDANQNHWPPLETCDSVCCGRGYRLANRTRTEKCDCQFQFCCSLACKECTITATEYECI